MVVGTEEWLTADSDFFSWQLNPHLQHVLVANLQWIRGEFYLVRGGLWRSLQAKSAGGFARDPCGSIQIRGRLYFAHLIATFSKKGPIKIELTLDLQ